MGKRCSLCGGKLDGRNICKECGLDNNKSDAGYQVKYTGKRYGSDNRTPEAEYKAKKYSEESWRNNDSSGGHRNTGERPGGRSLGDLSGQGSQWTAGSWSGQGNWRAPGSQPGQKQNADLGRWGTGIPQGNVDTSVYPSGNIGKPQKKKRGCLIASGIMVVIIIIIVIVAALAIFESELGSGLFGGSEEVTHTYYNPYEWVDEELPAEGEEAEYTLLQGSYVVGVHIPAGNYRAEAEKEYDWVKVTDWERGIFLFEYEEKDGGNYLDDLRLFDGAVVEIGDYGPVTLSTSNAQTADMKGIANPLTESCDIVGMKEQRAGKDFPAGVYDAELVEGYGMADLVIYYEDEEQDRKSFYFDSEEGRECKNIVIPEGAKFTCDEGMQLRLTPSELIETTDYLGYYKIHEGRYEEYGE